MSAVRKKFRNLPLGNNLKIVHSARKGLKPEVFALFAGAIKMSEEDLAGLLHVTTRTIRNHRDLGKNLDPVKSEHLLKLIGLYAKGEEAFGTIDSFASWLKSSPWVGSDKAADLLSTPGGVDIVSDELDRLAHGYVV